MALCGLSLTSCDNASYTSVVSTGVSETVVTKLSPSVDSISVTNEKNREDSITADHLDSILCKKYLCDEFEGNNQNHRCQYTYSLCIPLKDCRNTCRRIVHYLVKHRSNLIEVNFFKTKDAAKLYKTYNRLWTNSSANFNKIQKLDGIISKSQISVYSPSPNLNVPDEQRYSMWYAEGVIHKDKMAFDNLSEVGEWSIGKAELEN